MHTNDTPINILASFAYLYKNEEYTKLFFGSHRSGIANVMLDSGAFTLFNAKQDRSWLTLDNYCRFCEQHEDDCEKYVQLDVVGKADLSKRNYETMVARGLRPMMVLTMFDNEWQFVRDAMNVNKHICVAGGVTTKSDWTVKRFQDCYRESEGKALIHGLGYVTYPKIYQLPLYSVDSSSWSAGMRYGTFMYFDKGVKAVYYKDILNGKFPIALKRELEDREITPKMLHEKANRVGSKSILSMLSIIAWSKYQRYSYQNGKRLFVAIATPLQFRQFLAVNENFNTMTYEQYRKFD